MDTATGEVPVASPRAASAGAAYGAVPQLGPGWVVLRNCALGGGGPRVGLVLLHPDVGVALVDSAPRETDAVGRLLRALDARRFPAIFGGHPPVARVVLPADRLSDLDRVLKRAFEARPPLALAGGDGWVRTARAAIESESPVAAPERRRAKRRRAFPWRTVALAVVGAASAGALVLVSASARRDREAPPAPGTVVAMAPGVVSDLLPELAPVDDDEFTAPDVAAALRSAERPAVVEPPPEPEASGGAATAAAPDRNRPGPAPLAPATDVDQRLQHASPSAVPEPPTPDARAGATVATGPQESGSAPTAAASAEPLPAPAPAAGGAAAAVEPRSPPKRAAAAPVEPPPRPAPQTAAVGNRRAASPAPTAEAGGVGRCREILLRATMGEALSSGDREVLRRGCQPRG